jgi:hypothetical protein
VSESIACALILLQSLHISRKCYPNCRLKIIPITPHILAYEHNTLMLILPHAQRSSRGMRRRTNYVHTYARGAAISSSLSSTLLTHWPYFRLMKTLLETLHHHGLDRCFTFDATLHRAVFAKQCICIVSCGLFHIDLTTPRMRRNLNRRLLSCSQDRGCLIAPSEYRRGVERTLWNVSYTKKLLCLLYGEDDAVGCVPQWEKEELIWSYR